MLEFKPNMKQYAYRQAWANLRADMLGEIRESTAIEGSLPLHANERSKLLRRLDYYQTQFQALADECPEIMETPANAK